MIAMNPMLAPGLDQRPEKDWIAQRNKICLLVAEEYGISLSDLFGKCRARRIVEPKQLCMKLIRDYEPKSTLVDIGRFFCNMDHGSVIYSIKTINQQLSYDEEMRGRLKKIEQKL